MSLSTNIVRRQGSKNYYVRVRVPKDLVTFFAKSEIWRSLKTADPLEAKRAGRRAMDEIDQEFEQARRRRQPRTEDIARLAQRFYAEELETDRTRRRDLSAMSQADRELADFEHHERSDLLIDTRERLAQGDHEAVEIIADILIEDEQLAIAKGDEAYREICQALMRAHIEVQQRAKERDRGDYSGRPGDPLLNMSATVGGAHPKPNAERHARVAPCISELIEPYFEEQRSFRQWRQSTENDYRKSINFLIEIMGDRPINEFGKKDIKEFSSVLLNLPAKYGQAKRFRGLGHRQLLELTKRDASIRKMTPKTVKKHITGLSGLFSWASAHEHMEINPTLGAFKLPKRTKRSREERDAWSDQQLKALIGSPIWTGCLSESRRSKRGCTIVRDDMFWLPLISLFAPIRLEEIASLTPDDVLQKSDIHYIDIKPGPGKLLKSLAAERRVPVHEELHRIGVLEYVSGQRAAGSSRLFPGLKPGGADGRYGYYFTKKFGSYLKACAIEGVSFHSLRHTVITALGNTDIEQRVIDELDGHETRGSEFSRYSKGQSLERLKFAIDQISYPEIDFSHLYATGR